MSWKTTTSNDLELHRKGSRIVVTGATAATTNLRTLEGLSDADLASAMVAEATAHADELLACWNITGQGRMHRREQQTVLIVTFAPDDDEGYGDDGEGPADSEFTAVLSVVGEQLVLAASDTYADSELAKASGLLWPAREEFQSVAVYYGE